VGARKYAYFVLCVCECNGEQLTERAVKGATQKTKIQSLCVVAEREETKDR